MLGWRFSCWDCGSAEFVTLRKFGSFGATSLGLYAVVELKVLPVFLHNGIVSSVAKFENIVMPRTWQMTR